MTPTMAAIKAAAIWYRNYYRWTGPENIRGFHLHQIRRDLMLLCAAYRVEERKVRR